MVAQFQNGNNDAEKSFLGKGFELTLYANSKIGVIECVNQSFHPVFYCGFRTEAEARKAAIAWLSAGVGLAQARRANRIPFYPFEVKVRGASAEWIDARIAEGNKCGTLETLPKPPKLGFPLDVADYPKTDSRTLTYFESRQL